MNTKMRLLLSQLLGAIVMLLVTTLTSGWTLLFLVLGVALRIWASGYIKKDRELAIYGPYRFVRNPLYLGTTFIFIGGCFGTQNIWIVLVATALFIALHLLQIKQEEENLSKIFGVEYQAYLRRVPRLFPWKWPAPASGATPLTFSWKRVRENRGYETLLIIVIFYVLAAVIVGIKYGLGITAF